MATPTMFPTLPPLAAWVLYGMGGVLLLLALADWAKARGLGAAQLIPLSLGRFSPLTSDLMPLLELRAEAAKAGWAFADPSLHILDLMRALNEAGKRGSLTFYARDDRHQLPDSLLRDIGRATVPASEWSNLVVSSAGLLDLSERDNLTTRLTRFNPLGQRAFADVHLERRQAKRWLRASAAEFRGQHEAEKKSRS